MITFLVWYTIGCIAGLIPFVLAAEHHARRSLKRWEHERSKDYITEIIETWELEWEQEE